MIDDNTLCLKPFFESTVSSSLQQIFNEVHWSVLEVLVCVDKEFMKSPLKDSRGSWGLCGKKANAAFAEVKIKSLVIQFFTGL